MEPTAIHYGLGTQDGYCYLRDVHRLERKDKVAREIRARVAGRSEVAHRWVKQKRQNIERRIDKIGMLGVLPGRLLRHLKVEGLESR